MIKRFKQSTYRFSLLGLALLILIGGLALTNAKAGAANDKTSSSQAATGSDVPAANSTGTDLKSEQGQNGTQNKSQDQTSEKQTGSTLGLPAGWKVEMNGSEGTILKDGSNVGMVEMLGYYGSPEGVLPNHSEIQKSEDILTSLGKGKLYILNRSAPAAAQVQESYQEIYVVILMANGNLAYTISIRTDSNNISRDTEIAKAIVEQLASQAKETADQIALKMADPGKPLINQQDNPAPDNSAQTGPITLDEVTIKIGSLNNYQIAEPGAYIEVPYGTGFIPVFVSVNGRVIRGVQLTAQAEQWRIETRNQPDASTCCSLIDVTSSKVGEGDITLKQILDTNGNNLLAKPLSFKLNLHD